MQVLHTLLTGAINNQQEMFTNLTKAVLSTSYNYMTKCSMQCLVKYTMDFI